MLSRSRFSGQSFWKHETKKTHSSIIISMSSLSNISEFETGVIGPPHFLYATEKFSSNVLLHTRKLSHLTALLSSVIKDKVRNIQGIPE